MGAEDILIEGINETNSTLLEFLPLELISRIDSLITLLKITGVVVIGYIIFLMIRWFFGIRRHRRINKIYKKVYEIDRKLDVLLKGKSIKEDKIENKITLSKRLDPNQNKKIEKKQGLINRFFKKNKKIKKK